MSETERIVGVKRKQLGTNIRRSFSRIEEALEMPNLIEVQKKSYKWFVEEGIKEVFRDLSSITDYSQNLVLEFIDYKLESKSKYSVTECKERDATYAAPLKVRVRLINKETGEVKDQEIFMGDFPLMTESGTFVINGAERVVVSQLVRSPGIYFDKKIDKSAIELYSATIIPNRGAWIEYENDTNGIFYARIDKNRKIPVTTLIRALGAGNDEQIKAIFGEDERLLNTIDKDTAKSYEEGLLELYRKMRPGEPPTVDSATTLINNLFFDPHRYDLSKVGRFKYNKKLAIGMRILGHVLAEDVVNPLTGEIMAEKGEQIDREKADAIEKAGVDTVYLLAQGKKVKVFSNGMVDIRDFISFDVTETGIFEKVKFRVLREILENNKTEEDIKKALSEHVTDLIPNVITIDDIFSSINYFSCLAYDIGETDDIDHLGNRRIRAVGELLQNQFRIGLSRMERVIRERMTIQDIDVVTPQALINIKPVVAAIKEFFGSSPLSQFMDQTNPLAELTHKRRLSALGPGGLSRDRAGFEVRDVHHSHYGRMCPIETPEGPNIGLISYLSTFARINDYGFIEAPFRKVDKDTGKVTDIIEYMPADVEDAYTIAQASEPLDEEGRFVHQRVAARYRDEILEVDKSVIDYVDVSPKMIVSVATAMIPFLENDDANRALMGANMQRQAVPLLRTESPIVGTGMEFKAAYDSGVAVIAKEGGMVYRSSADKIVIKTDKGGFDEYPIIKFLRSNQGTCINQRPIVTLGQRVEKGDVIADGPSTDNGEIALGKNVLIGFMTWEGYNYEDAVLINERLVRDDVYTSIHIEEYEIEARDTKLGPEEITREIPGLGEDMLKDLDERGIIRIGAEVRSGDILVGKITPKGETEQTSEEKLLRAIFGEKSREVRDTSLKVPHGESGIVVDVKVFTRQNGDEMAPGINTVVRCYIAQKRKISVGDKMAGRHGNKGVISRILPSEDMPFLEDGTPLDIVLNPLGVPSRMNIVQVLEVHLGMAAKQLGWKIMTPVFDGANQDDIEKSLELAGLRKDGKTTLYDGRTGLPFDNPVTVGYMYFLKLAHLVDDKIHARSIGPYSLVTQQPLGGKAQFGGQRFGEMEVWALEAYGSAYTLQEILTVKSDDVTGRSKTYEAIVKGQNVPKPGVPESFKVLIKELQSLGLDMKVLDENDEEIELSENMDDEGDDMGLAKIPPDMMEDLPGEDTAEDDVEEDLTEDEDEIDSEVDDIFDEFEDTAEEQEESNDDDFIF
ncbi:MAG: DNA-directed RNA polymerase subunit beta [Bacillota bacterium]|nr:DNA-directed RNA polymerase subunit beta [Bacillota bacterium]